MAKALPSLTDLYDLSVDRLFLTGPQAILRLVLMQSARDRRAGLNTAGYVTGYRGSPVGTVDEWRWQGPTAAATAMAERLGAPQLVARATKLGARVDG